MNYIYVIPGTYSPPTKMHNWLIEKAAEMFPRETIHIVCSINPEKKPSNVKVTTLGEMLTVDFDYSKVIMIRGVRNSKESFEEEADVMLLNAEKYGITNFIHIVGNEKYAHISSSKVRELAAELRLEELKVNFSHASQGEYNKRLAENIVKGVYSDQGALSIWGNSSGHKSNMLNSSYKYTGYAIGGGYAIQLFTLRN